MVNPEAEDLSGSDTEKKGEYEFDNSLDDNNYAHWLASLLLYRLIATQIHLPSASYGTTVLRFQTEHLNRRTSSEHTLMIASDQACSGPTPTFYGPW